MREERLAYLTTLGAELPLPRRDRPARVADEAAGDTEGTGEGGDARDRGDDRSGDRGRRGQKRRMPSASTVPEVPHVTYRLRYAKLGRAAYLGHLDTSRMLARLFRRAGIDLAYSRGFHPKPLVQFSPALSLGIPSLAELLEVSLDTSAAMPAAELLERLCEVSPEGFTFLSARELPPATPSMGKLINACDLVIAPAADGMAHDAARLGRISEAFLGQARVVVKRDEREIDVRGYVAGIDVVEGEEATRLCRALDWPEAPALFQVRVHVTPQGSAKPVEVAQALGVWGNPDPRAPHAMVARLGFPGVEPENLASEPGDAASEPAASLAGAGAPVPAAARPAHTSSPS